MSKLTELLDELCPDGVEFAPFLDVVDVLNGAAFSSKQFNTAGEGLPLIRIRDVLRGRSETYYRGKYEDRYLVNPGDILIGMDGNFHVGRWGTEVALLNQRVCKVESKDDQQLLNGFLYYFAQPYFKALESSIPSGTVKHLSMVKMKSIFIPVPPLEVQQEIVRVLDAFTDLEQSLVSELALRKKQFEEYLSEVLQTSNSGWKSATLGDIGSVRMCKRIMKHQTSPVGDVPFFKIGSFGGQPDAYIPRELFEEYRSKYSFPRVGEILISAAGTIGRTVKYDGEAAYFQDSNIVWLENDETEVTNDYLYYWYKVINWTTDSGTIKRLYNKNLLAAGISYPNKAGQEEIVAKLNTFESLIQSIEQEINLRRTQYEFYRDELLSFVPKED